MDGATRLDSYQGHESSRDYRIWADFVPALWLPIRDPPGPGLINTSRYSLAALHLSGSSGTCSLLIRNLTVATHGTIESHSIPAYIARRKGFCRIDLLDSLDRIDS